MKNHDLVEGFVPREILVSHQPVLDHRGLPADGLHSVRITLNNPGEMNAYTTGMIKEVILALREASNDRAAVAVVLTGAGTAAFCAGGNTREYAEVYAGNPGEYRQYMRLFNDMVTAILHCDKPVICRVNGTARRRRPGDRDGLRLLHLQRPGGLQPGRPEARLGTRRRQYRLLPLFVGIERAMMSATLCQTWSAHRFYWLGGLTQIVPALLVDEEWVPNPLVVTDRVLDGYGRIAIGEMKNGAAREQGKAVMARGKVDLALLDEAVNDLTTKLLYTMPDCLTKTIESVRKHKLEHWDRNRESNRAWLSLNMMTEAKAGFRAFHYGTKQQREVDFVKLRQRLAAGATWSDELIEEIAPWVPSHEEVKA